MQHYNFLLERLIFGETQCFFESFQSQNIITLLLFQLHILASYG